LFRRIELLVFSNGVMNGIAAVMTAPGDPTTMKHFTIDAENHITVHASRKAARDSGAGVFSTEEQFADLIGPNNQRLVEIWNSRPSVKPVTKFANRKVATERIWKVIQDLGVVTAAVPTREPVSAAEPMPAAGAHVPDVAPPKTKASQKTTPVTIQRLEARLVFSSQVRFSGFYRL
jgi:hypothetical protein